MENRNLAADQALVVIQRLYLELRTAPGDRQRSLEAEIRLQVDRYRASTNAELSRSPTCERRSLPRVVSFSGTYCRP